MYCGEGRKGMGSGGKAISRRWWPGGGGGGGQCPLLVVVAIALLACCCCCCCCCCAHALSGEKDGVCTSHGVKFRKFSLEGQPPRRASKGAIGLTLCRLYRKKTCCDVVQTHAALLTLQRLATSGEASKECLENWEVLECSICDPRVGVTQGPPLLCPSFCDSLFGACAGAFFATEPLRQLLMPCGPKDVLCAEAHEWASNASTFCQLAGFSVLDPIDPVQSLEGTACFDGRVEPTGVFDEKVSTTQKNARRGRSHPAVDMLRNWADNMEFAEKITWAVGGLVLTAGALHLRRRSLGKRKASGIVLRNKLLYEEARARQQAAYKGSSNSSGARRERKHSLKAA